MVYPTLVLWSWCVRLREVVAAPARRAVASRVRRGMRCSRGQATAEYVLVLLGAAMVALVLIGYVARSGRIEGLLDRVFDQITAQL